MRCFEDIRGIYRREGPIGRAVMVAMFVSAVIYGGSKPGLRSLLPPNEEAIIANTQFTVAERTLGLACVTNPAVIAGLGFRDPGLADFEATSNAVAKASWLATGVYDDYYTLTPSADAPIRIGTNYVRRLMVFSHGFARAMLESDAVMSLEPFHTPMSFIAQGKWAEYGVTSRCWTASSPESTIITWENALLDRNPAQPLSFQMEFLASGDLVCSYGDNALINALTNATISLGKLSITGAIARATSLHFANIAAYGDGTGDADNDGLSDYDELMLYGTNPHEADTDGDGLTDLTEVNGGTSPLNPDTNNDGIPDGQNVADWASHPLWANATNANFTIRLAETNVAARAIVRVDDLAFLLCGTNAATLHLPPGVFHEINYATADGVAHGLDVAFGNPASGETPMRGGSGEDYGWHTDDPEGLLFGSRTKRGHATVALVSLSLVPQDSTCVHSSTGCTFRVEMAPDDWQRAKDSADLDNLVLMPDGSLFLPVPNTPGDYSDGTLVLGYPYLRDGAIMRSVTAHRCEGWSGFHCPICGTYHYSGNSCDHDPQCGAGHSPPEDCDCDPILVPFNCDDDNGDGQEDRLAQSLSVDEDDCIPFSPIRADAAYCCCNVVSFSVRVNSVSGNLRLWDDSGRLGTGSVSDGGGWLVEGVATNNAEQTSSISYRVLDWNDDEIATIVRKFVVAPSVSFSFDPGSVLPDGAVVVVKRSTDPVRINNTTATVHATGLADGDYRLVTDLAKFHSNNETFRPVELDGGASEGVELYGFSPSSAMGDATLSLQTVGGTTLCSTNFTVLWVDISMRYGQDDPFSEDNDCIALTTNRYLGKQSVAISGYEPSVGNVVEIVGAVSPADFVSEIGFNRDNIAELAQIFTSDGTTVYRNYDPFIERDEEPLCNDPCRAICGDSTVSQSGHVFDVDTPGVPTFFLTAFPYGDYFFLRQNFVQYACFSNKRCSDDFYWFSRTTLHRIIYNNNFSFEFLDRVDHPFDNAAGEGSTDLTW